MIECGSASNIERSINAPGSPSSPLQQTYFFSPVAFLANSHLSPVENPPPPRPLKPDSLIQVTNSSRLIEVKTL
jgi:hypothetical protein